MYTRMHTFSSFRTTYGRALGKFLLVCGSLAAAMPADAGAILDRIKRTGRFVIAYRESSIPFSYLDGDKKPVGYAVDLCLRISEAVRKELGMQSLTVNYVLVNSASRIQAVANGLADLECGSTTNNAERRKKVAFTIPHYITGARILVRNDSQFDDLPSFGGHRLVSTKGSTPLAAIEKANREQMLGIQIMDAPDHGAAVDMVARGLADGFAMDDVLLYGLRVGQLNPNKFRVTGKFLTIEPLAIMFQKDDPEFKKVVNDEMRRLIMTREAHALFDRWFMNPIPPKNIPLNLPMNYLLKDFWKYPTDVVPF